MHVLRIDSSINWVHSQSHNTLKIASDQSKRSLLPLPLRDTINAQMNEMNEMNERFEQRAKCEKSNVKMKNEQRNEKK